MRHLATIQTIADVQPIEGADAIEKVQVKGWWCVAKKGEFKPNDLCVYFEIDSLLPNSNSAFDFLAKGTKLKSLYVDEKLYTGYRLKTIKLRGQVSQGLALPFHSVRNHIDPQPLSGFVGDDVSEILQIVKYEAPTSPQLQGKVKGSFPGFLRKTDEERVQNIPELIEMYTGQIFYITEKLDGTSATYYNRNGVFGLCSRNLELLPSEGNTHWEIAKQYNLEQVIPDGYAVQGEIVGEGIQGNPLKLTGRRLYLYNAYNIVEGKCLDFVQFQEMCKWIDVPSVPVIESTHQLGCAVTDKIEALLAMADGASRINPEAKREGLVFRPLQEMRVIMNGSESRFSFKVISNDYLLKHEA